MDVGPPQVDAILSPDAGRDHPGLDNGEKRGPEPLLEPQEEEPARGLENMWPVKQERDGDSCAPKKREKPLSHDAERSAGGTKLDLATGRYLVVALTREALVKGQGPKAGEQENRRAPGGGTHL